MPSDNFTERDSRIEQIPETGCWVWMLACDRDGYGRVTVNGKGGLAAHRVFYEAAHGPIAPGVVLDHTCRVRPCVNPAHVRETTHAGNVLAPGSLARAHLNSLKENCPKCGGPFISTKRGRECYPCSQELRRQWRMRRKEQEAIRAAV